MAKTTEARKWVTIGLAARMLDASYERVRALMEMRVVTWRQLPGGIREVLVADVDRVARECVQPAIGATG